MATRKDKRRLNKALNQVEVTEWQAAAAAILLAINGIDGALEFVHALSQLHKSRFDSLKAAGSAQRGQRKREAEIAGGQLGLW